MLDRAFLALRGSLLALVVGVGVAVHQPTAVANDGGPQESHDLRKALALLRGAPLWCFVDRSDVEKRESLMERMAVLRRFDPETIREMICIVSQIDENRWDPASLNVYILNRYILAIPPTPPPSLASLRWRPGDGVVGYGHHDDLWPLSIDHAGRLRFTGQFGGYCGEAHSAVNEFDALRHRWGLRRFRPDGTVIVDSPAPIRGIQPYQTTRSVSGPT